MSMGFAHILVRWAVAYCLGQVKWMHL